MAIQQIRGKTQIKQNTVDLSRLELDFLAGSDWDISNGAANATLVGLKDAVDASSPLTKGQHDAAMASLAGGLQYQGTVDASAPGTTLDNRMQGDFFVVSVAGTLFGSLAVNAGDHVFANKDITGAATAADYEKVDNTESLDILRDADIHVGVDSTSDTKVLAASQGKVLQDQINAITSVTEVYGEQPAISGGQPAALVNTPLAGTVRVYLNGVRQAEGIGKDYQLSGSQVTFEYALESDDIVQVDYKH